MKGHKFHVRRKIMENEENRDLINKNRDLFFFLVEFWSSISILFLSYSWTLRVSWRAIGECGILGVLEQEGKGREGKCNRTSESKTTMCFYCRY